MTLEDVQNENKNAKRIQHNWENRFQRWSNTMQHDGTTSFGKCGYGAICDYCKCNDNGRPCVRAFNTLCRENGIVVDYESLDFVAAWNGLRRVDND